LNKERRKKQKKGVLFESDSKDRSI